MKYVILYMGSLALGGVGAWVISRWGTTLGVLDRANHRSSHDGVIPKGGGIGILAAFVFSAIALRLPVAFWAPLTAVALFSLYGDKVELSPKIRLPIQFLAAFIVLLFALPALSPVLSDLRHLTSDIWPLTSDIGPLTSVFRPLSSVLCHLFFSVFIVGTANYYNFMDGINGIAGITGLVAFCLIALFGSVSGADGALIVLSICIAAACLGFLPFNMPKARVFMGDVGSILLGFLFAVMVVALTRSLTDFMVLCAFLFPFYADELVTEYVRLRDGENLLKPHRRHIYQLLANEMAIAHWKVTAGYGFLQTLIGLGALSLRGHGPLPALFFLAACFIAFCLFSRHIRRPTELQI